MAVSIVMTGTPRSCTLTSGSNSMVVSSATGLVVGATIQGTGVPTGSRIRSISGTTVVMETGTGADSNATVGGAQNLIFSSVWGSILTISMNASGDTSNVDAIFNAGFGVRQRGLAVREIFFPGALGIEWKNMVAGSVFDFQNWTLEFGDRGYWGWEQSTISGELRGGYLVNGAQFIKAAGPTFISNNFKNAQAGGSNMFIGTATGAVTGTFRMNNLRVIYAVGSNTAPFFACGRMNCIVDNMILDYQGGSGPNAGISAAFGVLNNTTIVRANSGIGNPNLGNYATINGLSYSGIFTDTPQHKFAIPNNYVMEGYAPQVLSTQFLGGFQDNTTETFANIDLSTAGWGVNDLKTRYQRYGGPNTINFPRRVTFEFNDSTGANLTGVTLYIRSGSTSVVNAVQAGDYNANTQALVLNWTSTVASYRVANTITDTISQVAQVRRYGFIEQSTSYSLNLSAYSQPFFMLNDASLSGISEATAAAITTAGINWTTKTITPTADLSYDQINARIAWELAQTANSAQADPRSITGSNLTLAAGWTLVVNTGRTISAGTNITYLFVPTVTLNGTGNITAVYASNAGTSTIWRFEDVAVGSSIIVYDASGITKYFQSQVTSAGDYNYYIPPGTTGTYTWAIERYGFQRQSGTFAANTGGLLFYVPIYVEDVGISQTTQATVAAYTAIDTLDKFYDFTAFRRLSEDFIKIGQIATRSGTAVEIGNFNLTVNAAASVMEAISGLTITIKSGSLAPGSKYTTIIATPPRLVTAATTEIITANIEDGAGDSSVTIQGGSGNFTLWKLANSVPDDDYATGVNLGNVTNTTFRFLSAPGFKIVIRDNTTAYRINCPMDKGIYTRGLFFGDQVQLAQSAEVTQINTKVDLLTNSVAALPQEIMDTTVETGATVVESLRLHNAVLGGKVSGGGSATETFRDLADTKDRLVSSVTETGNRTAEIYDLT